MSDHTLTPYFPQDLENYAPWVAKYGLLAPYGQCQCGCGQDVRIVTRAKAERGEVVNHPVRYVKDHYVPPPPYATIADAFWKYCGSAGPSECWEWQGVIQKSGYGELYYKGHKYYAHRVCWEIHNGPIPDGLYVCHECDNRKCTNISHLWLGTHLDNVADMISKGRNPRGESHHSAKLKQSDVLIIRSDKANGATYAELAERYGVTPSAIQGVVMNINWKHTT